jgi:hypothetical protein
MHKMVVHMDPWFTGPNGNLTTAPKELDRYVRQANAFHMWRDTSDKPTLSALRCAAWVKALDPVKIEDYDDPMDEA